MRRFISILVVVLLANVCITSQGNAAKDSPGKQIIPGQILIKFKQSFSGQFGAQFSQSQQVQSTLQKIGAVGSQAVFSDRYKTPDARTVAERIGMDRWVLAIVSVPTDIEKLVLRLRKDPAVEIAEPNYIVKTDAAPNDPLYSSQQHLPQIKSAEAWDIQKGDSTVIIAILDTGVDWDHPDLVSIIWSNTNEIPNNGIDDDGNGYIDDIRGWDFVNGITGGTGTTDPDPNDDLNLEDNNPMDFNGHGSHCAGIAAAATNNSTGIASISWGCKVMPLRIGFNTNDGGGSGYSTWMARAFQYAADNGASVASLSFGTSGQLIVDASLYAFERGVVICNSAGNGNSEASGVLGTVPWVLKVASVDDLDRKASYSTYGTWVNISAPGGDQSNNRPGILSTVVNPSSFYGGKLYEYFQGTSMACPLVAGLAGLVKSKFPTLDAAGVALQICATSDDISSINPNYVGKLGYGRINAQSAVTAIAPAMKPILSFSSYSFADPSGNNNGIIEPGETIEMTVNFKNDWENATNVNASISTTAWGISLTKATASFGTIPGIRDINNSIKGNSSDRFIFTVSPDSIPRNLSFKITITADQGYSKEFDLAISILPSLLFVDDDDGSVNVESYYLNAFQSLGLVCDYWNRALQGPITSTQLSNYKTVVWGCEWAFPSLDADDRLALGGFLDNGGQLFLSGQDVGWDLCASDGEEYLASEGASKTWFEKYFKSSYQADNASTTLMTGVTNDPISDGLSVSFTEPLRSSTSQYPDVINPLSGAQSVFQYASGGSGAVRYDSTWKIVYFGFGGFEAISSESIRKTVMERIFGWFNGFQYSHTKLKDTESSDARPVVVELSSSNTIESVNLYWDTDGSFPFKKVQMNSIENGKFKADIPGQTSSTVQYATIVRTSGGYMPYSIYSYQVGTDNIAPIILDADSLWNTLSTSGIFPSKFTADDNLGLDTNSAYIHFKINSSALDSAKLTYTNGHTFSGVFDLNSITSNIRAKDVISYYYKIQDASSNKNTTKYPATGFYSFVIGRQLIDDFNVVRPIWDLGSGWGYEQSTINSVTSNAMSDSPGKTYSPNSENTLILTTTFDLSAYSWGRMYFWRAMAIGAGDTLHVEMKSGTNDWVTVRKMTGTFPNTWRKDSVDLPSSSNATTVRFRLKSDGVTESNGILLDNIEVVGNTIFTGITDNKNSVIPKEFALLQNYPNPFNPETNIRYELPFANQVNLVIFDMLGRQIAKLVDEKQDAGSYTASFKANELSSGIYFYRLTAGSFVSTKKMILIR